MEDMMDLLSALYTTNGVLTNVLNGSVSDYKKIQLVYLIDQGTFNQKSLAHILGMTEPALSMRLRNLEESGFIIKNKNSHDKRNCSMKLADAGREFLEKEKLELNEKANEFFSTLTEEEMETLYHLLMKLGV